MNLFQTIRHQFHPLHRMRQNRFLRENLMPLFDKPYPARVPWLPHRWWLKRLTHAAYAFAPDDVESTAMKRFIDVVRSLPTNAVFFDIGANVGRYTWQAAALRTDLNIHAFEPDKTNFFLLMKTRGECKHPSAQMHHVAMSDQDGFADFANDTITGATGTLEKSQTFTERHFSATNASTKVETIRLDSFANQFGRPSLIKIDVEGHEKAVFKGAEEVLKRDQPILLFESFCHPLPFR